MSTSSVVKRCNWVKANLNKLANAAQRKQQASELSKRLNELQRKHRRLNQALAQVGLFHRHDIGDLSQISDLSVVGGLLGPVRARMAADPSTLTAGQDWRDFTQALDRYTDTAERWLEDSWSNYIKANFPNLDKGLLDLLAKLPTFREKAERARALNRALQDARNALPADSAEIERHQRNARKLRKLLDELNPQSLPEEVTTFLRAALSTRGAKLTDLTPIVLKWLEDKQLMSTFRVRGS